MNALLLLFLLLLTSCTLPQDPQNPMMEQDPLLKSCSEQFEHYISISEKKFGSISYAFLDLRKVQNKEDEEAFRQEWGSPWSPPESNLEYPIVMAALRIRAGGEQTPFPLIVICTKDGQITTNSRIQLIVV